jgi:hypothetical protein
MPEFADAKVRGHGLEAVQVVGVAVGEDEIIDPLVLSFDCGRG